MRDAAYLVSAAVQCAFSGPNTSESKGCTRWLVHVRWHDSNVYFACHSNLHCMQGNYMYVHYGHPLICILLLQAMCELIFQDNACDRCTFYPTIGTVGQSTVGVEAICYYSMHTWYHTQELHTLGGIENNMCFITIDGITRLC